MTTSLWAKHSPSASWAGAPVPAVPPVLLLPLEPLAPLMLPPSPPPEPTGVPPMLPPLELPAMEPPPLDPVVPEPPFAVLPAVPAVLGAPLHEVPGSLQISASSPSVTSTPVAQPPAGAAPCAKTSHQPWRLDSAGSDLRSCIISPAQYAGSGGPCKVHFGQDSSGLWCTHGGVPSRRARRDASDRTLLAQFGQLFASGLIA